MDGILDDTSLQGVDARSVDFDSREAPVHVYFHVIISSGRQ